MGPGTVVVDIIGELTIKTKGGKKGYQIKVDSEVSLENFYF